MTSPKTKARSTNVIYGTPDTPKAPRRLSRLCERCDTYTTAKSGLCRDCNRSVKADEQSSYDAALSGGRWVRSGHVMRWQAQQGKDGE